MEELICDAKNECKLTSLAVFKPKQLLGFDTEKTDSEWSKEKLQQMREYDGGQLDLFSDEEWRNVFELVKKVPFKFFYRFKDSQSRERRLEIIDWEIGALYWNLMKKNNTETTLKKIKQKYFEEFLESDLHFFLGTTYRFHRMAPNPFMIIGVFQIPYEMQRSMF